jgi:hypothetical protein
MRQLASSAGKQLEYLRRADRGSGIISELQQSCNRAATELEHLRADRGSGIMSATVSRQLPQPLGYLV